VSLRPKPNSDKSLLICDCRDMIRREGLAAQKFSLPASSQLLGLEGNYVFTKLDIKNAYWGCKLPKG